MINVNLLPPEIKEEIAQSKSNRQVASALWKTTLMIFGIIIISGGFYFWFSMQLENTKNEYKNKEQNINKYGTLEEKAKITAERIDSIKAITQNSNIWSGTFEEIAKVVPNGVSLKSIKIDSVAKNRNQITGLANSKSEVAALRESMEKSSKFQYVDIESSTTEEDPASKKEFENFTITFSLKKGALK